MAFGVACEVNLREAGVLDAPVADIAGDGCSFDILVVEACVCLGGEGDDMVKLGCVGCVVGVDGYNKVLGDVVEGVGMNHGGVEGEAPCFG